MTRDQVKALEQAAREQLQAATKALASAIWWRDAKAKRKAMADLKAAEAVVVAWTAARNRQHVEDMRGR